MYYYKPTVLIVIKADITDEEKKWVFGDVDIAIVGRPVKGSFDIVAIACELWSQREWEWFHAEITPRLRKDGDTIWLT
jgi:hypothetical protein